MFNCLLIVMLNALWRQVECHAAPARRRLAKKLGRNDPGHATPDVS